MIKWRRFSGRESIFGLLICCKNIIRRMNRNLNSRRKILKLFLTERIWRLTFADITPGIFVGGEIRFGVPNILHGGSSTAGDNHASQQYSILLTLDYSEFILWATNLLTQFGHVMSASRTEDRALAEQMDKDFGVQRTVVVCVLRCLNWRAINRYRYLYCYCFGMGFVSRITCCWGRGW